MIRADQIPDEVWHTAMSTYHKTIRKNPGKAWQQAIAAALTAWPGRVSSEGFDRAGKKYAWLNFPLPTSPEGHGDSTEASDE